MDILDFTLISGDNLDSFSTLIPTSLRSGIKNGELFAIGSMMFEYPNGAIVSSLDKDTVTILSIYVDVYDRHNGTGTFLVEKLNELVSKVPGIYSIRAVLPPKLEKSGAESFFEAAGFNFSDFGGPEVKFTVASLEDAPLPKSSNDADHCFSGRELGSEALMRFEHSLSADGNYLMKKSLNSPNIIQQVSMYYVENNTVKGCVVLSEEKAEEIIFEFAYATNGAALLPMLLSALGAVKESYSPQTLIRLQAVNETSQKLVEKLVPMASLKYRKLASRSII